MTKYRLRERFEELLWEYLKDIPNKKDIPYCISCEYRINEESGEVVFYSDKKDVLLKIKKIDFDY